MGNGQYVSVLFVIPVIIDIHRHRFRIFTLVSEIHDNVDLIMGMKNIFELEGVIDSRESCFSFLSRSIPFFPITKVEVAPASQKMVMVEAPFIEELSGMAMAIRHESANHKQDKTEIYLEQSSFEDYKQNAQNCYF